MKKFLVGLMVGVLLTGTSVLLCRTAFATDFPAYTGYVNDYAKVLDSATKDKIEALCKDLESKTSDELAVVVVQSVAPLDSKSYAVGMFKDWGIGKKGKDNGILILLAMKERRIEIEVGYGLEAVLNDAKCGDILHEKVVPLFKEGKFSEGLYACAQAVSEKLISPTSEASPVAKTTADNDKTARIIMFIILGLVGLVIIGAIVSIASDGDGGGFFGGSIGGGGDSGGGGGSFGGGSSGGGGAGAGF